MGTIIRIQKEIVRLIDQYGRTPALEDLVTFINRMSPYEIVEAAPGAQIMILRNKKTLKELGL